MTKTYSRKITKGEAKKNPTPTYLARNVKTPPTKASVPAKNIVSKDAPGMDSYGPGAIESKSYKRKK